MTCPQATTKCWVMLESVLPAFQCFCAHGAHPLRPDEPALILVCCAASIPRAYQERCIDAYQPSVGTGDTSGDIRAELSKINAFGPPPGKSFPTGPMEDAWESATPGEVG